MDFYHIKSYLYKVLINALIISGLVLIPVSGYKLFTNHVYPLARSIAFLMLCLIFVFGISLFNKNKLRRPRFKNMLFLVLLIVTVFAFAGVEPFYSLKNRIWDKVRSVGTTVKAEFDKFNASVETYSTPTPPQALATTPVFSPKVLMPTPSKSVTPAPDLPYTESRVWEGNSYLVGGDYQPIILRNYKNAKDPSWQQLLSFLMQDDTDTIPYNYPVFVCADFAERLHNNAEKAGIKCAYVSLDMVGYTDPYNLGIESDAGHACNAFNTTHKGMVYIDCTGNIGNYGAPNNDMLAEVQVGKQYNLTFIFPSGGWYSPRGQMGVVIGINIHW